MLCQQGDIFVGFELESLETWKIETNTTWDQSVHSDFILRLDSKDLLVLFKYQIHLSRKGELAERIV